MQKTRVHSRTRGRGRHNSFWNIAAHKFSSSPTRRRRTTRSTTASKLRCSGSRHIIVLPIRSRSAVPTVLLPPPRGGGLVAGGCPLNPATGKNELMFVSEEQEVAMGQQADSQVIASIGLYPDPALQSYVQELGTKLAATSERPNLPWTFRVVDDPAVNAFAIPGGFVYVTRGILTHITNEAELATVMGHEIGHVTARHTAHEMSREQLANLGLVIGSIASSRIAQYAGLASQAMGVLFLKFSRDNEEQADELAVRYYSRAH